MAKRGRPKTVANDVHVTRYYIPDARRDSQAVMKVLEERVYKAYEDIHMMAFDEPIGWFGVNPVKKGISAILSQK
jgi:hypothetical protein